MKPRSPRHYIVVVHGIGEQADNETTVEVVHRFAEVRHGGSVLPRYRALLPANLSSQSIRRVAGGVGWSEFRGIPVDPSVPTGMFDGRSAGSTTGRNFRFVDLRWADILQADQGKYSSHLEGWAPALINRFQTPFTPSNWGAPWMRPLLQEIEATVIPFKRLLTWYKPEVAGLIFDNIIGDIHLYGDYARTRGYAVRRFHAALDQIHLRDYVQWCRFERTDALESYIPPVYTIIAHSLGSIMSFDALTYAFASKDIRDGVQWHESGSLPFPGYTEPDIQERETWVSLVNDLRRGPRRPELPRGYANRDAFFREYPDFGEAFPRVPLLLWRNHVKHFITLGAPIDKFHILWHQNYRHMGFVHSDFPDEWAAGWLTDNPIQRIHHYNLCDEQDPVGHHLDEAQSCENYNKIFDTSITLAFRDIVFRRYPIPGVAHTQYWKDQELFERLINGVIDGVASTVLPKGPQASKDARAINRESVGSGRFVEPLFVEVSGFYSKALEWAYFRIPLISAVLTGGLLSYGWMGWATKGFSLSYLVSIVAAIFLWVIPRPSMGYEKEVSEKAAKSSESAENEESAEPAAFEHHKTASLEKIGWLDRWKPRPSLFANIVRGAVTWRRILLWLNYHPHPAFTVEDAVTRNLRLSLRSDGGFKRNVWWRVVIGLVLWIAMEEVVRRDWCSMNEAISLLSSSPFWSIDRMTYSAYRACDNGSLILLTVTTCYLIVMGYVWYVFDYMKEYMEESMKDRAN